MKEKMHCASNRFYATREERVEYLWKKYHSILRGKSILDVGADECHLKKWLDADARYFGIGLGGKPDQSFDLDSGSLPFADRSYDVVICLDVLEHLEHIHRVFDEICRVSGRHVIVSLPNCLGHLWNIMTRFGRETPDTLMKYYGLPPEPVADRHKWFFDALDAEAFIRYRAAKNQMLVAQIDFMNTPWRPRRRTRLLNQLAHWILFRKYPMEKERLNRGPLWAVLEKK